MSGYNHSFVFYQPSVFSFSLCNYISVSGLLMTFWKTKSGINRQLEQTQNTPPVLPKSGSHEKRHEASSDSDTDPRSARSGQKLS